MNTTSFKYFISIVEYLKKSGREESEIQQLLLDSKGVDLKSIESDFRVDYDHYESLLDLGAELNQEPLFGFHLGKHIKSADFGALGYLVETSENLKQVIQTLMQFDALVADIGQTTLQTSNKQSTITWQPFKNKNRQVILRNITAWIATVRLVIDENLAPLSVSFSFELSNHEKNELSRWFSCPVKALAASNNIVFPNEYFKLAVTSKNKQIFNELLRMSELQLIELTRLQSMKIRVKKLLNNKASLEQISLAQVASSLSMSMRNLQKKLKREDTSFSKLLDEERQRRIKYLINKIPLGHIATQLGFAEQASLNKAFKRWYNCSPREYIQYDKH